MKSRFLLTCLAAVLLLLSGCFGPEACFDDGYCSLDEKFVGGCTDCQPELAVDQIEVYSWENEQELEVRILNNGAGEVGEYVEFTVYIETEDDELKFTEERNLRFRDEREIDFDYQEEVSEGRFNPKLRINFEDETLSDWTWFELPEDLDLSGEFTVTVSMDFDDRDMSNNEKTQVFNEDVDVENKFVIKENIGEFSYNYFSSYESEWGGEKYLGYSVGYVKETNASVYAGAYVEVLESKEAVAEYFEQSWYKNTDYWTLVEDGLGNKVYQYSYNGVPTQYVWGSDNKVVGVYGHYLEGVYGPIYDAYVNKHESDLTGSVGEAEFFDFILYEGETKTVEFDGVTFELDRLEMDDRDDVEQVYVNGEFYDGDDNDVNVFVGDVYLRSLGSFVPVGADDATGLLFRVVNQNEEDLQPPVYYFSEEWETQTITVNGKEFQVQFIDSDDKKFGDEGSITLYVDDEYQIEVGEGNVVALDGPLGITDGTYESDLSLIYIDSIFITDLPATVEFQFYEIDMDINGDYLIWPGVTDLDFAAPLFGSSANDWNFDARALADGTLNLSFGATDIGNTGTPASCSGIANLTVTVDGVEPTPSGPSSGGGSRCTSSRRMFTAESYTYPVEVCVEATDNNGNEAHLCEDVFSSSPGVELFFDERVELYESEVAFDENPEDNNADTLIYLSFYDEPQFLDVVLESDDGVEFNQGDYFDVQGIRHYVHELNDNKISLVGDSGASGILDLGVTQKVEIDGDEYEVTIVSANGEGEDFVVIGVNNSAGDYEREKFYTNSLEKVNGLSIYAEYVTIEDDSYTASGSFIFGAEEIEVTGFQPDSCYGEYGFGGSVVLDGQRIDGMESCIRVDNSDGFYVSELAFRFAPTDFSDDNGYAVEDRYLIPGETLEMPLFGIEASFDRVIPNLDDLRTTHSLNVNGDEVNLVFTNVENETYDLNLAEYLSYENVLIMKDQFNYMDFLTPEAKSELSAGNIFFVNTYVGNGLDITSALEVASIDYDNQQVRIDMVNVGGDFIFGVGDSLDDAGLWNITAINQYSFTLSRPPLQKVTLKDGLTLDIEYYRFGDGALNVTVESVSAEEFYPFSMSVVPDTNDDSLSIGYGYQLFTKTEFPTSGYVPFIQNENDDRLLYTPYGHLFEVDEDDTEFQIHSVPVQMNFVLELNSNAMSYEYNPKYLYSPFVQTTISD